MKEQVARADTERADSNKLLAVVRKGSEQHMVRLDGTLVGPNWAEKLTRSRVTEFVNVVDAVAQQLAYDALIRLRQGLEKAYLTVRMPCPVSRTRVSGAAATSSSWKSERSGDEKESEPIEGRPTETGKLLRR